jgi:protein-disulfide isomerase
MGEIGRELLLQRKRLRRLVKRRGKHIGVCVGILLTMGGVWLVAKRPQPVAARTSDAAIRAQIIRYVRAKFAVPDSVKLTVDPLRPFTYPAFLQTIITADDGKQKRANSVFLTKDRRYLIFGSLFMAGADPENEIVQHLRELFKIPTASSVTAGPWRDSQFPDLLATAVTVDDGRDKQVQDFYVTKDKRCLVVGSIFDLSVDPKQEALRTVTTANQPSLGPASAPVTIVEFSDLECPMCARVHEFLQKELLPKYAGKVRVVYKEFPLTTIHDWSLTGSIANQCAYQVEPATYAPYRSLIFKNQMSFNATNARDLLLDYGEQVGLDRFRLGACIDSKASLPRIEENVREGNLLGVRATPTSFVNGKMVVGIESPEAFYRVVDEALRQTAGGRSGQGMATSGGRRSPRASSPKPPTPNP